MAEYLSPEVYIEEVSSGIKPIQGVSTSVAGFVGIAERGPIGEAVPITSFAQFVRIFGGPIDAGYLAFAVSTFFTEGGSSCYVVRTCHYTNGVPDATSAHQSMTNGATSPANVLKLSAKSAGAWGKEISVTIKHKPNNEFLLELHYRGNLAESYDEVTMESGEKNAIARINAESQLVTAEDLGASTLSPADHRPREISSPQFLTNAGSDGLGSSLNAADFTGDQAAGTGLFAFDKVDNINLLAVPDAFDRTVHLKGYAYCELRKDCFYIADSQSTINTADDVVNYKLAQGLYSGQNSLNSKYGALYAPWVSVFDPRTGKGIKVPPCGVVAGRYASVDHSRGVHKAAAGIEDGRALSVLDVDRDFNDADQAKLNPLGINVIRKLSGVGPVLWGARTTSSDPEWTYLNVRRFFLFVEQSIEAATKWTVFEPNDPTLWKAITLNVSAFLRQQWAIGALLGLKEEQAFYVKCDAETNPPESVDLGRVITEVGLAVVKPAEFVILRFTQKAATP